MQSDSTQIEIYIDGACRGNPGPGGWGVLLRAGAYEKELFGGEQHTTNNRMELMAAIKALQAIKRPSVLRVTTDSQYVRQGITKWLEGWKKKGWRGHHGQPIKNQDLWEQLDLAVQGHQISWQWVRGHSGHPDNERVDALARQAIDRL